MDPLPSENPLAGYRGPVVRLRAAATAQHHPWIFRRTLRSVDGTPADGEEVVVVNAEGLPIGRGLYHRRSNIAVRFLSSDPLRAFDEEFFRERIVRAVALRREILRLDRHTDAYRLVHAESDGLSGLIVDRYRDLLVAEFFSVALYQRRELLRALLTEQFPDSRVVFKLPAAASDLEGLPQHVSAEETIPEDAETEITEAKMRFLVRPSGHKTGFFLDQRENRARWAELVRGARVLDTFAYTGGFAVAARTIGHARQVVAVDLDEKAVELGRRNARLNRAEIEWIHEDAFRYLKNQRHAVEPWDAISVDPPKWVFARTEVEEAGRKYIDINQYAIAALKRGGLLATFSCSGLVSPELFFGFVRRAALRLGRDLQVIHEGGAASDHPVSVACPETRYLKAIFARVI
jgi:23S rRNA (cytosine1962-C5)-methyltransferase